VDEIAARALADGMPGDGQVMAPDEVRHRLAIATDDRDVMERHGAQRCNRHATRDAGRRAFREHPVSDRTDRRRVRRTRDRGSRRPCEARCSSARRSTGSAKPTAPIVVSPGRVS